MDAELAIQIVNQSPIPIIEIRKGQIAYLNPCARNLFPALSEDGVRHPLLREAFDRIREFTGNGIFSLETDLNDACYLQTVLIQGERACIYVTDVSERKRSERLKDELISAVSHELKTPLTIIKGWVDNLAAGVCGELTEKQSYALGITGRHCNRLARTVNNLLNLSCLESGMLKPERQPVDLVRLIRESVQRAQKELDVQNMNLHLELPEHHPYALVDPALLSQVLSNLLDNAMRFAGGHIHICATEKAAQGNRLKSWVQVGIIDHGPGISEENLKRIFEKFVQIDRPYGGEGYQGTGLGLALCKKIIERHGGRIWAESREGRGTGIYFTLPRCEAAASQPEISPA